MIMQKQLAVVDSEVLTDRSIVYNVVAYDGNKRITILACDRKNADAIAKAFNDSAGFEIDVLGDSK